MATDKTPKTKAVQDAESAEAEVFGDGANTPLPVQEVTSHDEFVQTEEMAPEQVAEIPLVIPEIQEERVFGPSVPDVVRDTQPEQSVTLPMSVIEQMQRQIADLQARNASEDEVLNPLEYKDRPKLINVSYYRMDDGKQLLATGMKERVFPNGQKALVYQDGVDQDKKPVYKAIITFLDIENGEYKDIEVVYDNFIKLSTPMQVQAKKVNERIIDMTPDHNERVEVASYQESGGYVKRNGSGVYVKAAVQGKVLTFEIEVNGRNVELTSDVINIK